MDLKTSAQTELNCYMEVKKADGRLIYYKVVDEQNVEISKDEYERATLMYEYIGGVIKLYAGDGKGIWDGGKLSLKIAQILSKELAGCGVQEVEIDLTDAVVKEN